MNTKQVKLLRYFCKATGDLKLAAGIKQTWPNMTHEKRGKVSSWMKRVIMTLRAVADEDRRKKLSSNLEILKGFG